MSSKRIFIAWTRISRRSEQLSKEFDAEYYRLDRVEANSLITSLRLLRNSIITFHKLIKSRPNVVFTFHAHPLITLVGYLYRLLYHCTLIADLHTAAYMDYNRFPYSKLNRFLWTHADIVLLHNNNSYEFLINSIPALQSNLFVLEDPIPTFHTPLLEKPDIASSHKKTRFSSVFICRFSEDEPVNEFIEAVRHIQDVTFYITGNYKKTGLPKDDLRNNNIILTGFLSDTEYINLLSSVDFIVVLTTRDYTLLSGGYEALAFSKPIIISDKATLRNYFEDNVIYVSNDPISIKSGINKMIKQIDYYRTQSEQLKEIKIQLWIKKKEQLLHKLETNKG